MPCRWSPRSSARGGSLRQAAGNADSGLGRALRLCWSWLLLAGVAGAACIPMEQAQSKIGADTCVTGKVLKVEESQKGGTWFLDFCQDYRNCPFSVVVFAKDLRNVGDVRQLQGKTIEIFGHIKSYNGRAEIILSQARQLRGEAAKIPPLPRDYDVERHGRYRATAPSSSSSSSSSTRKTGGAKAAAPGSQPPPNDVEKPETPR